MFGLHIPLGTNLLSYQFKLQYLAKQAFVVCQYSLGVDLMSIICVRGYVGKHDVIYCTNTKNKYKTLNIRLWVFIDIYPS